MSSWGVLAERNRGPLRQEGFGRSASARGSLLHHDDLRGLLDHLGIERAGFVGCSMGGGAVIDFALSNPERALVLVGSAVSGVESDETPPEEWEELVAADEAGDLERRALRARGPDRVRHGPYRDPAARGPGGAGSRPGDEPDRAPERGVRAGRDTRAPPSVALDRP